MSKSKRTVLAESALLSGLVTQEQIDRALAAFEAQHGPRTPHAVAMGDEPLAEQLIAMGLLTPYQAQQLKGGRTKLNLGPYIVTDFLGQGGMGQVFKAEHRMMGREVAIKVLPQHKSTPEAIENFNREIRTQAKLDHPNLVRAFDAGHDGNVYFLVTEYVPGTDLRRWVRAEGRLTMEEAAAVIMQAARGLHYAHESGLVHRDVKPGNILVTPQGQAKVSDLGLAGFLRERDEDPRAGKLVGTADYIAPEHIKAPRDITPVSDIYGLGCTLYYAVTGKVPYPGGTTREKVRRHCEDTPWHPRRFHPDVSDEFVDVIADMMEKDPERRIQTAAEVAARLEPWVGEAGTPPAQQMTKSPWLPPPLPTGKDDTAEDVEESDSPGRDSTGSSSFGQDTNRIPFGQSRSSRPAIDAGPSQTSVFTSVMIVLAVAVPISMLIGAIMMLALVRLLQ